jgi:hypothetical protein
VRDTVAAVGLLLWDKVKASWLKPLQWFTIAFKKSALIIVVCTATSVGVNGVTNDDLDLNSQSSQPEDLGSGHPVAIRRNIPK